VPSGTCMVVCGIVAHFKVLRYITLFPSEGGVGGQTGCAIEDGELVELGWYTSVEGPEGDIAAIRVGGAKIVAGFYVPIIGCIFFQCLHWDAGIGTIIDPSTVIIIVGVDTILIIGGA